MKADGTGCPVRFLLLVIEQSRRQPVVDLQESLDLLSLWIRGTVSHYHWAHPWTGRTYTISRMYRIHICRDLTLPIMSISTLLFHFFLCLFASEESKCPFD